MNEKMKFDYYLLLVLAAALVIVLFFWETQFVYPLKIFVVFLHELSHGLAALLTGGSIVKIELSPDQGGLCYAMGGWPFLVTSAGYLGSLLWGGLILLVASRSRHDRLVSMIIGAVMVAVTFQYVRNGFGFFYGLGFGAAMFLLGFILPGIVNDLVLKIIGLTSILYAIADIKDDLITRTVANSDAAVLARESFGTPQLWGIIWIVIALGAAVLFLMGAVKKE